MILLALILIPLAGGLLAWLLGKQPEAARWISLFVLIIDGVLALMLWGRAMAPGGGAWLSECSYAWIPALGIRISLAADTLGLTLITLTVFLGILSVLASWREIQQRTGFFFFNLLWVLSGVIGIFLAMDLFLFYFFWELMLIPMFFLICIWGHENRIYAGLKFFLFTQIGGLLMLLGILGLVFVHFRQTGEITFAYADLLGTTLAPGLGMVFMLCFFAAFATKLPMFPLHPWLPDAHTEAPTAGSVILAGLLLKTGAYGLLRFAIPLFPEASMRFAPVAVVLGVIGILYGALLAYAQTDLKRLVAYTSVSHMGFVLLGIYSWNSIAIQGVVMQMICHGLSTGGLFILVGLMYERMHTRDIRKMGGLWPVTPKMGAAGMILAMASLGLPGLGNFVAEFLILVGSFEAHMWMTILATLGLVAATAYSLRIVQRVFHGTNDAGWKIADLTAREVGIMAALVLALVWLGLYPQPVIDLLAPAVERLQAGIVWVAKI